MFAGGYHLSDQTLALLHQLADPGSADQDLIAIWTRTAKLLERHLRADTLAKFNANMHGAVVIFCMDVGFGVFEQSTLRHRLNAHRFLEAVPLFLPHHSRNGKVDRLMKRRRQAEASLFCSFSGS